MDMDIEVANGPLDKDLLKKPIKSLTGDEKWRDIADLVSRWAKRNPEAMKLTIDYAADMRESLVDKKYGMMGGRKDTRAVGGGGTRIGMVIHPELMAYIQAFYPQFLDTNEDVAEFKKRFPKMKVPEK